MQHRKASDWTVAPHSGQPLPAQRVLSRSNLLPCGWSQPISGPYLIVTETFLKEPAPPLLPAFSEPGSAINYSSPILVISCPPLSPESPSQKQLCSQRGQLFTATNGTLRLMDVNFQFNNKFLALTFKNFPPNNNHFPIVKQKLSEA